jgi:hypothetical protein
MVPLCSLFDCGSLLSIIHIILSSSLHPLIEIMVAAVKMTLLRVIWRTFFLDRFHKVDLFGFICGYLDRGDQGDASGSLTLI